jgi:hypothetical protein
MSFATNMVSPCITPIKYNSIRIAQAAQAIAEFRLDVTGV